MSERQEGPEERASGGVTGAEASSGVAEQGVSGGVGGSEAASGGAMQVTGGAGWTSKTSGKLGRTWRRTRSRPSKSFATVGKNCATGDERCGKSVGSGLESCES